MKQTLRTLTVLTALTCLVPLTQVSCNAQTAKVVAKSAIDIGLATCIAEHADISDEAALREVCKWTDEFAPLVKELLSARKAGLARATKMGTCAPAPAGSAK